jgi:cystathionine beta-lyase/cystathionine gamma-synthase
MTKPAHRLETLAIHAGEPSPRIEGSVAMPVFQSATFLHGGAGRYDEVRYLRLSNTPNHVAVAAKLAALEGAEAALVTASGMAAISVTLLTLLRPGDRLLAQRGLYGGTHELVTRELARLGVAVDLFDGQDAASLARLVRPETRAVYVETITNPLVEVADLEAIAAFARARGLTSVIDNTFASPFNFQPIARGFDVVIHSCTKYLNGHSDLVAGAVVGSRAFVDEVTHRQNLFGGCLDAGTAALLHRGMKTLALRVARQNETALALAEALARHPGVARVRYPGLSSHPGHARAKALFRGFGGMLSFEPAGGPAAVDALLQRLTIPLCAPSLGGVETLVILPARTSHASLAPEERRAAGIRDELVRVSVGIEAAEDLVADFEQALAG